MANSKFFEKCFRTWSNGPVEAVWCQRQKKSTETASLGSEKKRQTVLFFSWSLTSLWEERRRPSKRSWLYSKLYIPIKCFVIPRVFTYLYCTSCSGTSGCSHLRGRGADVGGPKLLPHLHRHRRQPASPPLMVGLARAASTPPGRSVAPGHRRWSAYSGRWQRHCGEFQQLGAGVLPAGRGRGQDTQLPGRAPQPQGEDGDLACSLRFVWVSP